MISHSLPPAAGRWTLSEVAHVATQAHHVAKRSLRKTAALQEALLSFTQSTERALASLQQQEKVRVERLQRMEFSLRALDQATRKLLAEARLRKVTEHARALAEAQRDASLQRMERSIKLGASVLAILGAMATALQWILPHLSP